MDIKEILNRVSIGKMTVDEAVLKLKKYPYENIDFAKIDYHRKLRQGASEVIYGEGKSKEQILKICKSMIDNNQDTIIITRIDEKAAEYIDKHITIDYNKDGHIGVVGKYMEAKTDKKIVIATAGTSDIKVAEEAYTTAKALGNRVDRLYDVGVAGIHRLFDNLDVLIEARVIVVVAGMEGALASVIGGLVSCPVIAVPTSVGYGTSFGGVTALLSMLNSCSSGVSVVNIDNGFGAGYLSSMINHIN